MTVPDAATTAAVLAAVVAAMTIGKPVWLSWTIEDSGASNLRSGEPIAEAWQDIAELDVHAVLLNCSPPEAYAAHAAKWVAAGARIVGGCCEVGPGHIACLHKTLR